MNKYHNQREEGNIHETIITLTCCNRKTSSKTGGMCYITKILLSARGAKIRKRKVSEIVAQKSQYNMYIDYFKKRRM